MEGPHHHDDAPTSAGPSLPVSGCGEGTALEVRTYMYLRTHLLYGNHMRGMRTENRGSGTMETGSAQKRE